MCFQKHEYHSSSAPEDGDLRPWEHKPDKDQVKPRKRRAKEKSPKSRTGSPKVCIVIGVVFSTNDFTAFLLLSCILK